MTRLKDVRIELNTIGIGKVFVGEQDITDSVRTVDIRARAGTLTDVELGVVPGGATLSFSEAEVTTTEVVEP